MLASFVEFRGPPSQTGWVSHIMILTYPLHRERVCTSNSIIEYQESTTPELDEKYWSRLIKSDENPGWLWDPIENEWVADPELSKGGDE